jgi:hypothetical protein
LNSSAPETLVELSVLLDKFTSTIEYNDADDPLDLWDNCATTIPIEADYPFYFKLGEETADDPPECDVSQFVFS